MLKQFGSTRVNHWLSTYWLSNTIFFLLFCHGYLRTITTADINHFSILLFLSLAYIGQIGLLCACTLIPILPFILFYPRPRLIISLSAIVSASALSLFWIDIHLYQLYHFHINGLIWHIFSQGGGNEVWNLSLREKITIYLGISGFFLGEFIWSWLCWYKINLSAYKKLLYLPPIALIFSYMIFMLAAATPRTEVSIDQANLLHKVVMHAENFPLYSNVFALIPGISVEMLSTVDATFFVHQNNSTRKLDYPKQPLQFNRAQQQPWNIVIIAIDAWRSDMVQADITPNIYQFAQQNWQFQNHYSGGNATEPGIFSLFYSLPHNYWGAILQAQQGPVLLHEILQANYATGMFVSAETYVPPYNKTVFRDFPEMPTDNPFPEPYQRDEYITQKFIEFTNTPPKKFFSFIFYNTTHGYCTANPYPQPFLPSIKACDRINLTNDTDPLPYFNRYKNAVHYVDSLVGQVLNQLQNKQLLDHTLVLLLGDHGEEFNETHSNYWGHGSGFTTYQIKTPLIVHWPGAEKKIFTHQTSHYDIAPTLLEAVLGCTTSKEMYSVGDNLFNITPRKSLTIGSYIDFGIVEGNRVTRVLPGGSIEYIDGENKPITSAIPNEVLRLAFTDINRFYQNGK